MLQCLLTGRFMSLHFTLDSDIDLQLNRYRLQERPGEAVKKALGGSYEGYAKSGVQTGVEVCSALHNGTDGKFRGEPPLVSSLVESFCVHSSSQAQQPQVSLHLIRHLCSWQLMPRPAVNESLMRHTSVLELRHFVRAVFLLMPWSAVGLTGSSAAALQPGLRATAALRPGFRATWKMHSPLVSFKKRIDGNAWLKFSTEQHYCLTGRERIARWLPMYALKAAFYQGLRH